MSFSMIYLKIRFWEALSIDFEQYYFFKAFKSSISCLLGYFRWFSSFGRYLDRFGLRFSIIYVGISLWDALSVDFEPDLLLLRSNMRSNPHPESSISGPWTPGCSQGVPGELPRVEQVIQARFLESILMSFSMPESINFRYNLKSLKS